MRLLSQTRDKKKVVTAQQTAREKHAVLHRVGVVWSGQDWIEQNQSD
jgi:hypothetical protein